MKKSIFLVLTFLITISSYSQIPQGISYQAVAFNSGGNPITNGNVGVKISILDNSITGTVVYSETYTKTTNAQGLFNLNIGQGTPSLGTFSTINWGTNSKFLKVEVDPAGGTNYTNVGTNQLMSVPYALLSGNVSSQQSINNVIVSENKNSAIKGGLTVIYSDTEAKGYYVSPSGGAGSWNGTATFSTPIMGTTASNYTIIVYSNTEAKGYYVSPTGGAGAWNGTVTFSSPIIGGVSSNYTNIIYSATEARGYYVSPSGGAGNWNGTATFSSPIKGAISSNFITVLYSDTEAKGYFVSPTGGAGNWNGTVTFTSPIKGAFASGDVIIVYSDTEAKGYYVSPTGGAGNWNGTATFSSPIKNGVSSGQ
ncbi:hypothetical protein ACSVH2_11585 [Flavobacterium sp. RSB2_4_14]|uniref:hypothetical protein n=1 Tax=Flavobacterium sp. RSB2_4_14 TaxID=3447665 RepID=UPI003F35B3EF